MQFVDLGAEHASTISLQVKQRNTVSTTYGRQESFTKVTAFALTPDQQKLVTLERLSDPKTQISVNTLKFWNRTTEDVSDFRLEQVSHINCGDRNCVEPSITAVNDSTVAVCLGQKEVKIWSSADLAEGRTSWTVVASLKY